MQRVPLALASPASGHWEVLRFAQDDGRAGSWPARSRHQRTKEHVIEGTSGDAEARMSVSTKIGIGVISSPVPPPEPFITTSQIVRRALC